MRDELTAPRAEGQMRVPGGMAHVPYSSRIMDEHQYCYAQGRRDGFEEGLLAGLVISTRVRIERVSMRGFVGALNLRSE